MPFARCGPVSLFYELRGVGPRLLYIGGTGGDLRRPSTAFDRQLCADFEVLRFDQRGMGQSDKPEIPYTMGGYAADAAALLDAVGWDHAAVLGYSFGGMVAQELALAHPQKALRLVLLSTTSGGAGGASYPMHELAELPPEEHARRLVDLGDLRRDAAWREANAKLYDALVEDALAGILLGRDEPGHLEGARRQLEARRSHDTWARLPRFSIPVTVCAGEYDGIAPVDCQAALAQRIPRAVFRRYQGGHMFFLQDPAAYPAIRDALLASLS
jgi:3-oxoadipate enol-lactonase